MTWLRLQCPQCKRMIRGREASDEATENIRRFCWKCRTRWSITIKPRKIQTRLGGAMMHTLDWCAVGSGPALADPTSEK